MLFRLFASLPHPEIDTREGPDTLDEIGAGAWDWLGHWLQDYWFWLCLGAIGFWFASVPIRRYFRQLRRREKWSLEKAMWAQAGFHPTDRIFRKWGRHQNKKGAMR